MAEEIVDPQADPTDPGQDPNEPGNENDPGSGDNIGKGINDLKAEIGRMRKSSADQAKINQSILDRLEALSGNAPPGNQNFGNTQPGNPLAQLNERWQEQILSGNVVDVLDEYNSMVRKNNQEISTTNKRKITAILGQLEEANPFVKDIKGDIHTTALELVGKGYTPEDAASFAFEKHRGDYLSGLVAMIQQDNPHIISTLKPSGGGVRPKGDSGKWPDKAEKAYQRDKNAGIVKDRKEWTDATDPRVLGALGITA